MDERPNKKDKRKKKAKLRDSPPPRHSPPPSLRPYTIPKTGSKGKELLVLQDSYHKLIN